MTDNKEKTIRAILSDNSLSAEEKVEMIKELVGERDYYGW